MKHLKFKNGFITKDDIGKIMLSDYIEKGIGVRNFMTINKNNGETLFRIPFDDNYLSNLWNSKEYASEQRLDARWYSAEGDRFHTDMTPIARITLSDYSSEDEMQEILGTLHKREFYPGHISKVDSDLEGHPYADWLNLGAVAVSSKLLTLYDIQKHALTVLSRATNVSGRFSEYVKDTHIVAESISTIHSMSKFGEKEIPAIYTKAK